MDLGCGFKGVVLKGVVSLYGLFLFVLIKFNAKLRVFQKFIVSWLDFASQMDFNMFFKRVTRSIKFGSICLFPSSL